MDKASVQTRHAVVLSFLAGLLLAGGIRAQADVVAYDNFNNSAGNYINSNLVNNTTFVGQNPPTYGFTGAWAGSSTAGFAVQAQNFTVTGLANGGGSLALAPTSNPGTPASREAYRPFTSTGSNTSLWFGSAIELPTSNVETNTSSTDMLGFLSGNLGSGGQVAWADTNGAATAGSTLGGFAWGISNGSLSLSYQSAASGAGSVTTTAVLNGSSNPVVLTAGTTYWLVANLTIVGADNDNLTFYLESSSAPSQANLASSALATLTLTGVDMLSASQTINTLQVYDAFSTVSGSPVEGTNFDDVAVATTYADLVAAPEPSTLALVASCLLFAVAFGALRRRPDPA